VEAIAAEVGALLTPPGLIEKSIPTAAGIAIEAYVHSDVRTRFTQWFPQIPAQWMDTVVGLVASGVTAAASALVPDPYKGYTRFAALGMLGLALGYYLPRTLGIVASMGGLRLPISTLRPRTPTPRARAPAPRPKVEFRPL